MHPEGFFNLTYSFTRTEGHSHEFVCHRIHMISAHIAACEEPRESRNEDLGKGKGMTPQCLCPVQFPYRLFN